MDNFKKQLPAYPTSLVPGAGVPGGWAVIYSNGDVSPRDMAGKSAFELRCKRQAAMFVDGINNSQRENGKP